MESECSARLRQACGETRLDQAEALLIPGSRLAAAANENSDATHQRHLPWLRLRWRNGLGWCALFQGVRCLPLGLILRSLVAFQSWGLHWPLSF